MAISKLLFSITLLLSAHLLFSQSVFISNDVIAKKAVFGNAQMKLTLDYNRKAGIVSMLLKGTEVLDRTGIFSKVRTPDRLFSSGELAEIPRIRITGNQIILTHIVYGPFDESWTFTVSAADIKFAIRRKCSAKMVAEQLALPAFQFNSIDTWEGAYQDYGGIAWFYLFNKPLDTYGVHSNVSTFWNSRTDIGLDVSVTAPGKETAMDYSRTREGKLSFNIGIADTAFVPRLDSGTRRRLFVRARTDVWAPVTIAAGTSDQQITLSGFNYKDRYDRGRFQGINGSQVSAVLNTIARIGVIGKQHFGGNSWHTPYGPICLHEQYIAQMGLAINDSNYLKGYQDCLDFYRDHAMKPDGRVWPRWAYTNEDMMAGEVNDKGFYEAQWGYLLDANPDFVTNIAELYDQTGNKAWVETQQASCEKALDWLMNRDSDSNGLVEMIPDSHKEKKSSDWIDIVWASYENAFVNAKLYHALLLWADIERQLGADRQAQRYAGFAKKLKNTFNKATTNGGLWDEAKQCYIHWREKDGSVHGNNMVTPVNFMAIAYGICTDSMRTKSILDGIEMQMEKERLFFWPICLSSYQQGEVNDWQIPFPEYENGDLFLSWGALGVKAYASYKPELALKYVKNVLARYAQDGLAFQRYGRTKQDGRGDDILSGNCLSVVGLYQAIYGINPLYNRFYLEPHLTESLNGTKLNYQFRGERLAIDLNTTQYSVSNGRFRITSGKNFGYYHAGDSVSYFNSSDTSAALLAGVAKRASLSLQIRTWNKSLMSWTQSATGPTGAVSYRISGLPPGAACSVLLNDRQIKAMSTDHAGIIRFSLSARQGVDRVSVETREVADRRTTADENGLINSSRKRSTQ